LTEDKMNKALRTAVTRLLAGNNFKKLTNPTVPRGKTAIPKDPNDQESIGIRLDFDGKITGSDGNTYNKYQMQFNAGKIPSVMKRRRDENGSTHPVLADVLVKQDGTKDDVEASLNAAIDEFIGKGKGDNKDNKEDL